MNDCQWRRRSRTHLAADRDRAGCDKMHCMYTLIRPLLWTMDAERAHNVTMDALHRAGRGRAVRAGLRRLYARPTPALAVDAFGLSFANCIGLAAGLDKNGRGLAALAALGFGFLEVGTVTPLPQDGNPRPRMWRLPRHDALINRLGFNNEGADAVGQRLADVKPLLDVPLGVNIGKNAATPLEDAWDDYRSGLHALHSFADYVVINISSPNTPGLRALQHASALDELLGGLRAEIDSLPGGLPLLVKVAPDLTATDLDDIGEACTRHRIDGVIATNTTVGRDGIGGPHADEAGGLSGAPLTALSHRIVAALYRRVGDTIPIVGVGGIMTATDAYNKIKAGATLIQVLTGFVYAGPAFPRQLAAGLQRLLERDGFGHVREAVGVEAERYTETEAER